MTQGLDDAEVGVVRQVEVHRPQSGSLGERDEAARRAVDDGADGQTVGLLPPGERTNTFVGWHKLGLSPNLDLLPSSETA